MQALSGMVVYFIVMNDYGFKPGTLMGLNLQSGYVPHVNDVYKPDDAPSYGNSFYNNPDGFLSALAWGSNEGSSMDLRLFYTNLVPEDWAPCQYDPRD
jgi:hypothetical protein